MRAGWWALIVGLVVGGALALAIATPIAAPDHEQGPVLRALDLERGSALDARRAAAVADAAERCLAGHGVMADVPVEAPPSIPDADLDPVAWAERWGFGVATAAQLPPVGVPAVAPAPLDGLERSCRDAAADEVYGLRDRLLAPLRPALEALGATIDADPASRAADAAWVDCARRATEEEVTDLPRPTAPGRLDVLRAWFAARSMDPDPWLVALERRVAASIARCDVLRVEGRRSAAAPHERAFVRAQRDALARIGAAIRAAEATYPEAGRRPTPRRPHRRTPSVDRPPAG